MRFEKLVGTISAYLEYFDVNGLRVKERKLLGQNPDSAEIPFDLEKIKLVEGSVGFKVLTVFECNITLPAAIEGHGEFSFSKELKEVSYYFGDIVSWDYVIRLRQASDPKGSRHALCQGVLSQMRPGGWAVLIQDRNQRMSLVAYDRDKMHVLNFARKRITQVSDSSAPLILPEMGPNLTPAQRLTEDERWMRSGYDPKKRPRY